MACLQCTFTDPVPTCTTTLRIGTITTFATAMFIFVQNLTTGKIYRQASTVSGAAGEIDLTMANPTQNFYNKDSSYEVWVTLATNDSDVREDITVGTATEDCYNVNFTDIYDSSDDKVVYALHTLSL